MTAQVTAQTPTEASGTGPDPVAAYLAAVEDLLARRLADLRARWVADAVEDELDGLDGLDGLDVLDGPVGPVGPAARGGADAGEAPDPVLGDHDVPGLVADVVLGGGKRFRPLMCFWGWLAGGGRDRDDEPVRRVGAALELLHAFALAQDDVMDGSATRRGRPSVHAEATARHRDRSGCDDPTRYGESIGVLVGDLAHSEADALVCDLPDPVRRLWWRTCLELVRGQARDLSGAAAGGGADAERHAWQVARWKSGGYTVQRPLELGAACADAPAPARRALSAYGRLVGEAFALRDDLLGVFGDPDVTGKPARDDLRSGKATLLLAWLERSAGPGDAVAALRRVRCHEHDEADVETVAVALEAAGIRERAEAEVARRHRSALAVLDAAPLDPAAAAGLAAVADQIAWRDR